jgi:phosphatidylglycerophosphatase A
MTISNSLSEPLAEDRAAPDYSPPRRKRLGPDSRFMRSHAAHWIAQGFGSGLPAFAPFRAGRAGM